MAGAQLHHLGLKQNGVEQFVETQLLERRDLDVHRRSAPRLGNEPVVGKLLPDAVGVGFRKVDLVDGNNDGNLGFLGMVDGFESLGHDAIVGRHDQDDDVRDLGAAGAHQRERLMAGSIEEGHLALGMVHFVGADVLRDAAVLARSNT